jgi:dolichol kinase
LVLGWLVTELVLLVLGILIAIKGIVTLIEVLKKKKKDVLEIVYPVLSIVVGLMLAFGNALDIMIVIVGVLLIVDGAIGLIGSLKK